MRGLLEKDISIIKTRKQTFIMFIGIMIIMGVSMDLMFLVGYGTMLFGIWTISTVSYDEFDNGMAFLMTLPITAEDYVKEKFLFCGAGIGLGWIFSIVIGGIMTVVKGENPELLEMLPEMIALFLVFLALVSIMLAVELKFGIEKSRMAMMILGGAAFAVGIIGSRFMPDELPAVFEALKNASDAVILSGFVLICAAVTTVSYLFSSRVISKKQY